jgi:RNA polymerase sigma-70 factor (ECF subfamily)
MLPSEELIRVCAEQNDGAAWEEFVARFQRVISLSVIRTARTLGKVGRETINDLIQDTYLKLCANRCRFLCEFAAEHPEAAENYVRAIAANVVRDHLKAHFSHKRGAGQVHASIDTVSESEAGRLGGEHDIERQILLKQIDQCLEEGLVGPDQERDRLIFWLYYQQGMTARSIAAMPAIGLTLKGVESAILRLTRGVRGRILGLNPPPPQAPREQPEGFRSAESY